MVGNEKVAAGLKMGGEGLEKRAGILGVTDAFIEGYGVEGFCGPPSLKVGLKKFHTLKAEDLGLGDAFGRKVSPQVAGELIRLAELGQATTAAAKIKYSALGMKMADDTGQDELARQFVKGKEMVPGTAPVFLIESSFVDGTSETAGCVDQAAFNVMKRSREDVWFHDSGGCLIGKKNSQGPRQRRLRMGGNEEPD